MNESVEEILVFRGSSPCLCVCVCICACLSVSPSRSLIFLDSLYSKETYSHGSQCHQEEEQFMPRVHMELNLPIKGHFMNAILSK